MQRSSVVVVAFVAALGLGVGGLAVAQDAGTPAASPDCPTPAASPAASPDEVTDLLPTVTVVAEPGPGGVTAASPEASPDAAPVASDECPTPAAGAGTGAAAEAVTVDFVDIAVVPAAVTVPADTDVRVVLTNKGAAPHNFTIDDPAVTSGDLGPGVSVEVVVNLPAGTYEFSCSIPGHAEAGMVGTLTVP